MYRAVVPVLITGLAACGSLPSTERGPAPASTIELHVAAAAADHGGGEPADGTRGTGAVRGAGQAAAACIAASVASFTGLGAVDLLAALPVCALTGGIHGAASAGPPPPREAVARTLAEAARAIDLPDQALRGLQLRIQALPSFRFVEAGDGQVPDARLTITVTRFELLYAGGGRGDLRIELAADLALQSAPGARRLRRPARIGLCSLANPADAWIAGGPQLLQSTVDRLSDQFAVEVDRYLHGLRAANCWR